MTMGLQLLNKLIATDSELNKHGVDYEFHRYEEAYQELFATDPS
jgi:hypothetical protein